MVKHLLLLGLELQYSDAIKGLCLEDEVAKLVWTMRSFRCSGPPTMSPYLALFSLILYDSLDARNVR